jgi:SAM-dependent methyltransferase
MAQSRPLRILSLCSGAARIEAGMASLAGPAVQWTLMDLNESLLQSAGARFPEGVEPELIVGNLNEIRDFGEQFDVIVCVSGLHHIVELERVVDFAREALVEDGEFWSIGEAIGRNGNRLWDRDYAVADAFFRSLPSRLRHNRGTGAVDARLPDLDCSAGTFEGIRSEEIESLLTRSLEVVEVPRRNCFLWRLVNLAYADNYDLGQAEDVDWLQRAVQAEVAHFRSGGRPTAMHAVCRRPRV